MESKGAHAHMINYSHVLQIQPLNQKQDPCSGIKRF